MSTQSDSARPRIRTRRSPLWLLVGIVAVCLGGLGSAFVFGSITSSDHVLRVNRTIHRGEVIATQDVSVVSVGAGLDVRTVSDQRVSEVVGRPAVTDIPAGSLLVEGTWGEVGQPSGQSRVGVRLEPGRYPATDMRPGTPLLIVALPEGGAEGGAEAPALPGSVSATLVAAPAAQPDGRVTFDLYVPDAQAELVARLAATDRLAVVQVGGAR